MKKILGSLAFAAVVLVGMSSAASAAPLCASQAVTAGLSCSLGGLTFDFNNVSFSPTSAGDALNLESALTGVSGNDIILGFQINAGTAGFPVDIVIDYTVTSATANISGIDASYLGTSGTIFETAKSGSTIVSTLNDPTNNNGVTVFGTPESFGPYSSISIHKDIHAITFSEFTDSVVISGVPEPASLSMMGLGLLGLGLMGRRKRKV
jgi:hypothetical protein